MPPPSTSRACLAAALLAVSLIVAAPRARAEQHVAVISIDGLGASELFAGPSCLSPRSTLRALAAKGAYSRGVRGVLPTITYPSHATLSTGVMPTRHGVHDNGLRGVWFKERSRITVETLWDAARRAKRTVAIVTWPSTYGAAADWLVPEDLDNFAVPTASIRAGSTPGLFDALASGTDPGLMPFTHAEAGLPLDAMTARFAAQVVKRHKPGLLLAHFLDYDHRMHAAPWSADACRALDRTDKWLAHIVDAYRLAGILERTTFFVVSDHGFLPVRRLVSVFALLKAAGWDALFPGHEVSLALEPKHAGGSIAFYPGPGAAPDWGERIDRQLRPRLEKAAGGALRWLAPKRARAMGGFPGALFVLCARPGFGFALRPTHEPAIFVDHGAARGFHGYCPDEPSMNAVFIASGAGVRRTGPIARMAMVDVAPTIAAFLSAPLPQATGRDRSELFRSRSRLRNP